MNKEDKSRLLLWILALVARLALAVLVSQPGYMDAAYYTAGAVHMAQGGGFTEPFIWNYLNEPAGIPHPGFLYWMPLPSLIGAPYAALFPGSFFALQVPFAVLSAFLPLLAYGVTRRITEDRMLAWAAGLLVLFSGFFFPYWTLPETFTPFTLFGSLALWLAGHGTREGTKGKTEAEGRAEGDTGDDGRDRSNQPNRGRWILVGMLVGLAHLTRADGVLLLPVVAVAPFVSLRPARLRRANPAGPSSAPGESHPDRDTSHLVLNASRYTLCSLALVGLGYALVMGPWFARNVRVIGAPLSPAGTKTIWLTEYDDLFCYNCQLSPAAYFGWGIGNIIQSKLFALWTNFQRFVAEDCLVFLLPFVVLGLYRLRRRLSFALASLYLMGIYLAHSLVFTFPGWRGGFFHASTAALPFLHVAGIEGLDAAVRWASGRRRNWRYPQARVVFVAAAVTAAIALSGYVAWQRIPTWHERGRAYEDADRWLDKRDDPETPVMVGNPPAFWLYSNRPAIAIPNGDIDTLLQAADRYAVRYVLLETDHPQALSNLYAGEVQHPRLTQVATELSNEAVLLAIR